MQITCHDCKYEFELDLETRQLEDKIGVGFECPYCHTWHHSYYTTPRLEQQRELLELFKAKANRSDEDWQRYRRKKQEFQQSFDLLNPHSTRVALTGN